jgi:hypothetical protein
MYLNVSRWENTQSHFNFLVDRLGILLYSMFDHPGQQTVILTTEVSNRFAALEVLDTEMEANSA